MWRVEDKPLAVTPEEFLSALFMPEEKIRGRFYLDYKSDVPDKGRKRIFKLADYKLHKDVLEKHNNKENRSVCFVVNGGGDNDEAVKAAGICRAQFMEHDEVSIEEQLEIINNFPLEPSAVVRSRHSLHCYWFLKAGADINRFRKIQLMFCDRYGCDRKMQNESRCMRLPGFYNRKECFTENREQPFMVSVIHWQPDLKYTQDEIVAALKQIPVKAGKDPKAKKKKQIASDFVPEEILEGYRTEFLISQLGKLKHTYLSDEEIRSHISALNETKCVPPLSEAELESEVFPALKRFPSEPPQGRYNRSLYDAVVQLEPERRFKWSELGNGELFAEVFKDELRWNVTANEWYHYDGRVWSEDTGGMIAQAAARELQKCLLIYSTQIQDDDTRSRYQKHIAVMGSLATRKKMLEDARSLYFVKTADFDTDPMLLNVENGVLDLRSGKLLQHDGALMLSKICRASYDPEAKAPRWKQFIDEVMQGNAEKAAFLQKATGYALIGEVIEDKLFILYGKTTRNGKGTFVDAISEVFGDYALSTDPETFAKRERDSSKASPDLARLGGCRFLSASEPDRSMVFDSSLLKRLTGRDPVKARFLHQEFFEFIPKFKMFINTNYLPTIKDDTVFESDRINIITFDRHFSEEEQDKNLRKKLRTDAEKSEILNWLLEGLARYQKEGLAAPECVKAAVAEYRWESDAVSRFMDECTVPERGQNIAASEFYWKYQGWCDDNGVGFEGKGAFFAELRKRKLMAEKATVNGATKRNVILNYRLLDF